MWSLIIVLVIMLIFAVWIFLVYAGVFAELLINIPILWIVIFRSHVEIFREKKYAFYFYPFLLISVLFLSFNQRIYEAIDGKYIWWVTLYLSMIFIIAQSALYIYTKVKTKSI